MITAYLPKLHASRRFDMRISNCSEYMKSRQNHATCRLWKTLEPQICLRCLWKCFQRVQRPQIELQLTWFGLQNIDFGNTNDFLIFSVFLAFWLYVRAILPPLLTRVILKGSYGQGMCVIRCCKKTKKSVDPPELGFWTAGWGLIH